MTQEELAERSGICRKTISRIEHGKTIPSFHTAIKLSQALNVDPVELATGEDLKQILKGFSTDSLVSIKNHLEQMLEQRKPH